MSNGTPISISASAARMLEESTEIGAEEPYVIVTVADLTRNIMGITIPSAATTRTGPWEDADEGELLGTLPLPPGSPIDLPGIVEREYCWGLNGLPAPIPDPSKIIILVGVMENDDASPNAARSIVNSGMAGALANVVNSGMTRGDMVKALQEAMAGLLDTGAKTGAPNFDDRVGWPQEVRLTADDVKAAAAGSTMKKVVLGKKGSSDGQYRVAFTLNKG